MKIFIVTTKSHRYRFNISFDCHQYQVAYAIGIAEPLSLYVEDYGTGKVPKAELIRIIKNNFDLRPGAIVR